MRRPLLIMISTTFITWIGARITAVALPLVALAETGEAWTTGLVGGMAGLPLITVGWWGRAIRDKLTSGRALGLLMLMQAAGLAIVPAAAAMDMLGVVALCASGLITGVATALLGPAQRALVSDFADAGSELGETSSPATWLAWQDLAHRVSMVFAPPAGAWLVVAWGSQPLLWFETLFIGAAAMAMFAVGVSPRLAVATTVDNSDATQPASPSAIAVLRARPDVAVGILMAGVGGITWFAFSLGLALLGVDYDMPGALIAAGMAGYGAASVVTAFLVPLVIDRLPPIPTMATSWVILGLSYVALPYAAPDLFGIAAVAGLGGLAMPWGIASLNALISKRTAGADRRAAFTAQIVLHSGGGSLGLLVGGAIIGWAGAGPVLIAAGVLQVAAALVGQSVAGRAMRSG